MLKEESIILGYYDSYPGINSRIGLLTRTGVVWKFDLLVVYLLEHYGQEN